MQIVLSHTGASPIYAQITAQIKSQILAGQLTPGDALPSIRLLAKELRISVITTKRAYEDLERDGFIVTVPGKGSFVAATSHKTMQEEQLRTTEQHLAEAVAAAKGGGITLQQLLDKLQVLWSGL